MAGADEALVVSPGLLTELQAEVMASRREVERQGEFKPLPHQQLRPVG